MIRPNYNVTLIRFFSVLQQGKDSIVFSSLNREDCENFIEDSSEQNLVIDESSLILGAAKRYQVAKFLEDENISDDMLSLVNSDMLIGKTGNCLAWQLEYVRYCLYRGFDENVSAAVQTYRDIIEENDVLVQKEQREYARMAYRKYAESLEFTDEVVETLWYVFEDMPNFDSSSIQSVPDRRDEYLYDDFMQFTMSDKIGDVLDWFDEHHSKGLSYLYSLMDIPGGEELPQKDTPAVMESEAPAGNTSAEARLRQCLADAIDIIVNHESEDTSRYETPGKFWGWLFSQLETDEKSLSELEIDLSGYRPNPEYTWDDICDMADGAGFGEPTLRAKDEARYQVRCLMLENGEPDPDLDEIPEESIEKFCDERDIRFDMKGNIVK